MNDLVRFAEILILISEDIQNEKFVLELRQFAFAILINEGTKK